MTEPQLKNVRPEQILPHRMEIHVNRVEPDFIALHQRVHHVPYVVTEKQAPQVQHNAIHMNKS